MVCSLADIGSIRNVCSRHAAGVLVAPSEPYREKEAHLIEQALKRLPAEFRETLALFEFEGWSYKTIAAGLNIPLGTVMSRLSRARRLLQQELTRCVDSATETLEDVTR